MKRVVLLAIGIIVLDVLADEGKIILNDPVIFSYSYSYSASGNCTGRYKKTLASAKSKTRTSNGASRTEFKNSVSNETCFGAGGAVRTQMGGAASSLGPAVGYVRGDAEAYCEAKGETRNLKSSVESVCANTGTAEAQNSNAKDENQREMVTGNPTLIVAVTMQNLTKNDDYVFIASNSVLTVRVRGGAVLSLPCKSESFVLNRRATQIAKFEVDITKENLIDLFGLLA